MTISMKKIYEIAEFLPEILMIKESSNISGRKHNHYKLNHLAKL